MKVREKVVEQTDETTWSKGLPVAAQYNEKAVPGTVAGSHEQVRYLPCRIPAQNLAWAKACLCSFLLCCN